MTAGLLIAALRVGLLVPLQQPDQPIRRCCRGCCSGVRAWDCGPAVVAVAMSALAAPRAGLASAVNNTAHQAGAAIAIAAFGALAGARPRAVSSGGEFVAGMRAAALVTVGIWIAAAIAALVFVSGIARS